MYEWKSTIFLICLLLPVSFGSPVTPEYGWQDDHVPFLCGLVQPFVDEVLDTFNATGIHNILLNIFVKDVLPFKPEHRVSHYSIYDELSVRTDDPKLIKVCKILKGKDDMHVPVFNQRAHKINVIIFCELKKEPKPEPTSAPEEPDYNIYWFAIRFIAFVLVIFIFIRWIVSLIQYPFNIFRVPFFLI